MTANIRTGTQGVAPATDAPVAGVSERNRIAESIARIEARLNEKIGFQGKPISDEALQKLDKEMRVDDITELFTYQNMQSQAFATGILNLAEAQYLYTTLGGELPTLERFNSLPLATRIGITKVMAELIQALRRR